ncbi:MAG TPA: Mth938-like domain-containing protein [Rhodanobacteraceae bacterium]|nr:Mth938-like domain-containing protein [Rhodanobacteraceae bacterium]
MELNLERPRDYLFVRRADAHTAVVVDRSFTRSIILARDKVIEDWPVADVATMTPEHAAPILALKPDVVLLGTGARQQFPSQAVLAAFLQHGTGVEVMDNAAAARTWDILASEGRNVVATFILCDRP